jgi:hypothetical protein
MRFGDFGWWPKPQRRPGWLHRLINHRQQLDGQGVQVDLVA